jgi:hypothetical protein
MEFIFIVILFIHGSIHLMGSVKAFSEDSLPDLNLAVSKPAGTLWFTAFLIYLATILMFLFDLAFWWAPGIVAVLLSQGLVLSAWRDAKYGTIPNLIVLVVSIIACAGWLFERSVDASIDRIMSQSETVKAGPLSGQAINGLPDPVRRWLENSGAADHERISFVKLKQTGEMKTDPGQEEWADTEAEQVFNVDKPSFVWSVEMQMMPGVTLSGRDLFVNGNGDMLIKLYSMITVVDETGKKIDRGALQRFLSEIVWFPTAAVNDYISWSVIDSTTAEATMSWQGISESVRFHFTNEGDVKQITANRYMGGGTDAIRQPWIVKVLSTAEVSGVRIPTEVEVSWDLDTGLFTWYRFKITDLQFMADEK